MTRPIDTNTVDRIALQNAMHAYARVEGSVNYGGMEKAVAAYEAAKQPQPNAEVQKAVDALFPMMIVQGDEMQRGNPSARQFVNSNRAWGVTGSERSAHQIRKHVEVMERFLLSLGFSIDGAPHGQ